MTMIIKKKEKETENYRLLKSVCVAWGYPGASVVTTLGEINNNKNAYEK